MYLHSLTIKDYLDIQKKISLYSKDCLWVHLSVLLFFSRLEENNLVSKLWFLLLFARGMIMLLLSRALSLSVKLFPEINSHFE